MSYSAPPLAEPSSEVIARLVALVGEQHAFTNPSDQAPYLTEWRNRYHGKTPVVLRPGTTEEVSEILKIANQEHIGVVAQGGNTGLVGGQIPREAHADIVLSVQRLNRLRRLDKDDRHMIIEAGATLSAAHDYAHEANLQFPLRLASEGSASIGGSIATNAGGVHVLAHGSMRALTLGVEAVLANGDVWDGLRTLKKDNTGYNLKDLMAGSEGTLGIVTAAALKLVPLPAGVATAMIGAETLADIGEIFAALSAAAGSNLIAFEFMSARAFDFVVQHMPESRAPFAKSYPWTVLIDVASCQSEDVARETLEQCLADRSVSPRLRDSALAATQTQAQDLWRLRDGVSEAQKYEGGSIKHDISIPIGRIAKFIAAADAIVAKVCPGARPCPFGHFGDGNIHYNVSQPEGADTAQFLERWNEIQDAVHALVTEFDGSISAEHGIGIMKRDALKRAKSDVELNMMRAIKTALDPNGILNPGKLL
ncbi:MAG: FAD-binding oxidoreductase [Alphaproteobacteria bacterium]|nr:FAD-binding oxidoreductase [Alphaproteobacteria bacterium]